MFIRRFNEEVLFPEIDIKLINRNERKLRIEFTRIESETRLNDMKWDVIKRNSTKRI